MEQQQTWAELSKIGTSDRRDATESEKNKLMSEMNEFASNFTNNIETRMKKHIKDRQPYGNRYISSKSPVRQIFEFSAGCSECMNALPSTDNSAFRFLLNSSTDEDWNEYWFNQVAALIELELKKRFRKIDHIFQSEVYFQSSSSKGFGKLSSSSRSDYVSIFVSMWNVSDHPMNIVLSSPNSTNTTNPNNQNKKYYFF